MIRPAKSSLRAPRSAALDASCFRTDGASIGNKCPSAATIRSLDRSRDGGRKRALFGRAEEAGRVRKFCRPREPHNEWASKKEEVASVAQSARPHVANPQPLRLRLRESPRRPASVEYRRIGSLQTSPMCSGGGEVEWNAASVELSTRCWFTAARKRPRYGPRAVQRMCRHRGTVRCCSRRRLALMWIGLRRRGPG